MLGTQFGGSPVRHRLSRDLRRPQRPPAPALAGRSRRRATGSGWKGTAKGISTCRACAGAASAAGSSPSMSPRRTPGGAMDEAMDAPPYDLPLPSADSRRGGAAGGARHGRHPPAHGAGLGRRARGLPLRRRDPRRPRRGHAIAAVMHMEGAEAIGPDLDALYLLHAAGLRSLGPVWSRPTIFGHGVPFRYPGDPDTGPGLTPRGRDSVRACDELRILVDLSHLERQGLRRRRRRSRPRRWWRPIPTPMPSPPRRAI